MVLPGVLAGDERIARREERWHLADVSGSRASSSLPAGSRSAEVSDAAPLHGSIITMALATTGADPRRHRIARVAVVRREGSVTTARLDTPVRTEQRVAGYLRTATRVSEDDLETAPAFGEIVPPLRDFLDGETVYVYGAKRVRAFLEAEFRRSGQSLLTASFVEIDDLIRAMLAADLKPGLLAAARELGVPHPHPGLPSADAEVAARIIGRLRARHGASPGRADLEAMTFPPGPDAPLPFTRAWLQDVTDGPGVYVFEDRDGQTLYVGKAASLHRRLSAYVGRQPGANRQLEALAVRAAHVITIRTPSDLEATLLESRLIRERQPAFNVAQQARPPTTIVRAGLDETSPRVRLVSEIVPDGARYFGPFESASAARQALAVARSAFPAAFVRRRRNVDEQRRAVLDVCQMLAGQKAPALERLQTAMRESAARGDQSEVDRLRCTLRDVQQLDVRPSILAGLGPDAQLLVLERMATGQSRTHLLQAGRRLVSVGWGNDWLPTDPAKLRALASEMIQAAQRPYDEDEDESEDVSVAADPPDPDEPALVLRWLTLARARIELARVPPPDA